MKVKDVMSALERFAPLPLQEDYDNAGLQAGLTEAEVSGVLLCLDVTEDIVREAVNAGCNLIVAHHPLIFRDLRSVTDEDYVQRTVRMAVKADISIVAMHTNLDCVEGGVNHEIAARLGASPESVKRLGTPREANGRKGAMGVICELPEPLSAEEYVRLLKDAFQAQCVMTNHYARRAAGGELHPISRVAICGGAGGFLLREAVNAGADALLTGEMRYHDYFGREEDILISVVGHYESEQFTQELLRGVIARECQGVRTLLTKHNTNPIKYN